MSNVVETAVCSMIGRPLMTMPPATSSSRTGTTGSPGIVGAVARHVDHPADAFDAAAGKQLLRELQRGADRGQPRARYRHGFQLVGERACRRRTVENGPRNDDALRSRPCPLHIGRQRCGRARPRRWPCGSRRRETPRHSRRAAGAARRDPSTGTRRRQYKLQIDGCLSRCAGNEMRVQDHACCEQSGQQRRHHRARVTMRREQYNFMTSECADLSTGAPPCSINNDDTSCRRRYCVLARKCVCSVLRNSA